MNHQRKPMRERYSYFRACALRYRAGLIPSRSRSYNWETLEIFWPLYSETRQLRVAGVSAWTVQHILTGIWYLLFGQGRMFIFFCIAECVDFCVVEHYKDEFNTCHQNHFGRVTNTAVLPGSESTGWLLTYWVIWVMVEVLGRKCSYNSLICEIFCVLSLLRNVPDTQDLSLLCNFYQFVLHHQKKKKKSQELLTSIILGIKCFPVKQVHSDMT